MLSFQEIEQSLSVADIYKASAYLRPLIHHTPLFSSRTFSQLTGAMVYLKAENMQRAGSFKIRGASYKISQLSTEERKRGVVAASAGNHAQGVAIAAAEVGVPCTIVMPVTAPLAKVVATQSYGATVVLHGESYDEAVQQCRYIQEQGGAVYIPAFDDYSIIAGQGTLGLEILEDLPDAKVIVAPIGGGGLISGIALAAKAINPAIKIIGVQASGAAAVPLSLSTGDICTLPRVNTIADGIAVKRPGAITFPLIQHYVDEVVQVDDEAIVKAIVLLLERSKLLVEGAGAVGLAALLAGTAQAAGKKVVVVLSGGNIDTNLVSSFLQHGLAAAGRYLVLQTVIPDKPGALLSLLTILTEQRANIVDIVHHRTGLTLPIQGVEVTMTLETRDRQHCATLLALFRDLGYPVVDVGARVLASGILPQSELPRL